MDPAAIGALPRFFSDETLSSAVRGADAEMFGRLVSLRDSSELRSQFQSVGGIGFPPTVPPLRQQRDEEALILSNAKPQTAEQAASTKRYAVSIGTRYIMAWASQLSDRVYFYDLVGQCWNDHLSLHSPLQKRVSQVQFRRGGSPNEVLVACERGLCVWNVRWHERVASVRLISHDDASSDSVWHSIFGIKKNEMAIAMDCSPDGLFVAVVRRSSLSVFDVNAGLCLTFSGSFGESCCFSRDGAFLAVGSASNGAIRVWTTLDWVEHTWVVPPRNAPCLLASSEGALAVSYHAGGRFLSRLALDRCEESDIYEGSFALPLPARHMAMSPCGRRLAIVFESEKGLVGVVDSGNLGALLSLGCVQGEPEWGEARQVVFRNCGPGALLAIIWTSGAISFVEMLI